MSEQYPLLCEDVSDEEKLGSSVQRRRPMSLRGRAKYHVKGAAAIMTRWPDHWSSLLNYWWLGLGMISLITFIIYNILFSIVILQPADTRPTKYASLNTFTQKPKPSRPDVFMHVFIDDKAEADLRKYVPYIEIYANKYKGFTFNLIIVANDTIEETSNLSDEKINANALDSIWDNDLNYGNIVPKDSIINIKFVSLSKYLDDSPIKKYWKALPTQFIQFLVRTVSVWDKGGIAVNPIILTPDCPHVIYVEKFMKIIKNFKKVKAKEMTEQNREMIEIKNNKISPKVNNIRDIINSLDSDSSKNSDKEILHASESKFDVIVTQRENKLISNLEKHVVPENQINTDSGSINTGSITNTEASTLETNIEDTTKKTANLWPSFLDYLFDNKKTKSLNNTTRYMNKRSSDTNSISKDVNNKDLQMRNFWDDIKSSNNDKPMIISAKGILNDTNIISTKLTDQDDEKLFELTVDLKGNLIATETACHAFIGNVFTNAIHHNKAESLTDFIIKEISIFCKGLLTSCMGIDVILV